MASDFQAATHTDTRENVYRTAPEQTPSVLRSTPDGRLHQFQEADKNRPESAACSDDRYGDGSNRAVPPKQHCSRQNSRASAAMRVRDVRNGFHDISTPPPSSAPAAKMKALRHRFSPTPRREAADSKAARCPNEDSIQVQLPPDVETNRHRNYDASNGEKF